MNELLRVRIVKTTVPPNNESKTKTVPKLRQKYIFKSKITMSVKLLP